MSLISDPVFYLLAIPVVLLIGISKGGFAGSLGILSVPILSLMISPVQAAAIVLPILCVMDIFGLIAYRRVADWRNLGYLLPGAVTGILAGYLLYNYLSADFIKVLLGVICVVFTLNHYIRKRPVDHVAKASLTRGSFWGSIAGFTSFVAHAGGPPLQFYMLPQKIDKTLYVGTSVWFFFVVNYVKLIPYALLDQFSLQNIGTSLVLLPLAPIGIWLGVKAHKLISEDLFYRIAYVLVLVTGGKLLWDGLAGMNLLF
ncbi:TSUP family transporter [Sneathiella chungangensis]|uniref:Probable membrane transporter protein n=1 Tax=Sneathiella chungangensis TaxID=1418234 RepID=A0A845MHJ4_9PROT|nr:sulfite exporter TauE/SafE family protein [Sneathiella chungangensis]MZR23503.1 TSUP family transporter [Sneathiella chungangensis]